MNSRTVEFKVVIAGPFGVGKTTLIEKISKVPVVGTEVPTTGDEAVEKDSTTVGLEYGRFVATAPEFEIHLVLYGTPGQERFRFMWETVAVGADGFIVLIDATRPETWEDALAALEFFAQNHAGDCIVGANRTDKDSPAFVALADWLSHRASVPVVPCDVTNEQSARDLLVSLFTQLIGDGEIHDEHHLAAQA